MGTDTRQIFIHRVGYRRATTRTLLAPLTFLIRTIDTYMFFLLIGTHIILYLCNYFNK